MVTVSIVFGLHYVKSVLIQGNTDQKKTPYLDTFQAMLECDDNPYLLRNPI